MSDRRWYEALAFMADSTSHHHMILAESEEEVEQRMRGHFPAAVMILIHQEEKTGLWSRRNEERKEKPNTVEARHVQTSSNLRGLRKKRR